MKRKYSVAILITIVLISLSFGMLFSLNETTAKEQLSEIKSDHEYRKIDFSFNICGEENDPKKVFGTPENPAPLKRGTQIVIPFCILNVDIESRNWELTATDPIKHFEDPQHGISVSFNNKHLQLPARSGEFMNYHNEKDNAAEFNAFVNADNKAELGVQSFMVLAKYHKDNGTSTAIGHVVYVNIEE